MKIRPVEAELFHVGGRTELKVAFRNVANASKKRVTKTVCSLTLYRHHDRTETESHTILYMENFSIGNQSNVVGMNKC